MVPDQDKHPASNKDEKYDNKGDAESIPIDNESVPDEVIHDSKQLVTQIITVDDDPSLSPWSLRAWVIGAALSAFGGVLAEIFYFKPQTVLVSTMFLAIISYILGKGWEIFVPSGPGVVKNILNPGPFNKKEHVFIIIMSSAAANSALGTEVLAVQRLYYNITPNPASSLFLLWSSQLIGYGIAGLLRTVLLYPTKMLYPGVLPLMSMIDAFYQDGGNNRKRLKLFWVAFGIIFIWEIFPEWIFPLLTGFSILCLAKQNNADFTRIFGGSNGNEGLGLLSFCFDWNYVSGGVNPFAIPFQAQFSNFIGYLLCIVVLSAVYYKNIWQAQNFPFLSQLLFYENGTVYNQTLILNEDLEVDPTLLAEQGLPFYASTWVVGLLSTNLGMAATFTHLLLWNRSDLRDAWSWATPTGIKRIYRKFRWDFWNNDGKRVFTPEEEAAMDPHYREMLKYPDAPNSWYLVTFFVAFVISMVIIYKTKSTLPWWGLLIALALATLSILFFGALFAITGFAFIIQPFVQMIGGFIHPGKPMANMYFVLYSYNSVIQGQLLLRDLKIAQYAKLPPRAAYVAQLAGTLLGALLNFILMNSIIDSRREILLSVEGTNIWSGQQPQQYNSQAIAWGGLSHQLFAVGKRYQWVAWSYVVGLAVPVPFWVVHKYFPKLRADYLYTPVICYYIGWLIVGINSSITSYFAIAWFSQFYLRRRFPSWFRKYNYILGAALDGGTQVMVFILSFAVFGASGDSHAFPTWWGNNEEGNFDRCLFIDS